MKKIIRDSLVYLAIIVLILGATHGITGGQWIELRFYGSIFIAALTFRILKNLTDKFECKYFIFEIVLEFALALTVFLAFGWFFEWYDIDGIGNMCIIVVCVYIVSYFLNLAKTKKEITFINDRLNDRKKDFE